MTSHDTLAFWMTVAGTLCWVVCFWWMGRISREQSKLMESLRLQSQRIERLSRIEHDLIKEVHPQVGAIKEGVDEMIATVKENADEMLAAVKSGVAAQGQEPRK